MAFVLHVHCNEGFNAAFISRVSRLKYRQHIEARDVSQFLWQSLLLIIEAELDCAASTEMCCSPAACWEGSEPESSHCHHVAPACAVVWWNLSDKCSRMRSSPTNLTVIQLSSGEGRVKSSTSHQFITEPHSKANIHSHSHAQMTLLCVCMGHVIIYIMP